MDPILVAARDLVDESLKELRSSIAGLPVEALNWRPPGRETNSLAVLATHATHSTRMWLSIAMDVPLPERDRDSEFRATAGDADSLLRLLDDISKDCRAVLRSAEEVDWAARRETDGKGGDASPEVTAAYSLIHATEHLRGHVDQMELTRRLWEAKQAGE